MSARLCINDTTLFCTACWASSFPQLEQRQVSPLQVIRRTVRVDVVLEELVQVQTQLIGRSGNDSTHRTNKLKEGGHQYISTWWKTYIYCLYNWPGTSACVGLRKLDFFPVKVGANYNGDMLRKRDAFSATVVSRQRQMRLAHRV